MHLRKRLPTPRVETLQGSGSLAFQEVIISIEDDKISKSVRPFGHLNRF